MEEGFKRVHKMGKYSQGLCRRCSLVKASNHQHVKTTRTPKDCAERRHSGAHNYVGQFSRQNRVAQEDESWVRSSVRSSTSKDNQDEEWRGNCAKCPLECRLKSRTTRAVGKEDRYRGKDLAAEMTVGLLTRSTSCGDVCNSVKCKGELNSGGESDSSEVCGNCVECEGENILGRYKGIGDSLLPDLNRVNKEGMKGNQLGLEVMLSLINGPMQSVIDSKDEQIRNLERAVERLECENKQTKVEEKPGDASKIFTLEKTLDSCVRQIEQLEEERKTAHEKVRLFDDLRMNDKECIDILRLQITDLEMKLSTSDDQVREVEKDGRNQHQRLKQQCEARVEELQDTLRLKDIKLRDFGKIKSRVVKQRQELEDKKSSENELRDKMSEQVLELRTDLQLQQTKLNMLGREKKALEESLSQSENLQRQDQKSSYVLQMKIVELQEKLEASYRKNEELDKQREASNARCKLLEDRLNQNTQGRRNAGKTTKENQDSALDSNPGIENNENGCPSRSNESELEISGKCPSVLDDRVNNVLRDKVVELHEELYKGHQRIYAAKDRSSNDEHNESLRCNDDKSAEEIWRRTKQEYNLIRCGGDHDTIQNGNLNVSDITSKKMEMVFTGDKRRPVSDESSSRSSSASSSRRGSAESPRTERRQLKVLKVRKVSKENITQFQQNAFMSFSRHSSLKDVRHDPCGSTGRLNSTLIRPQCPTVSHRPPKEHSCKI